MNKVVTLLVATLNLAVGCTSDKDDPASDKDQGPDNTGTEEPELPEVFLNELQSSNTATLQDEGGAYPDWIELWNGSDAEADISGWWITDDLGDVFKWQFPEGTLIPAGGFLILFADEDQEEGPLHVNFALSANGGEDLGLFGPNDLDNPLVDSIEAFQPIQTDWSLARQPDGGALVIDDTPSPGAANN